MMHPFRARGAWILLALLLSPAAARAQPGPLRGLDGYVERAMATFGMSPEGKIKSMAIEDFGDFRRAADSTAASSGN